MNADNVLVGDLARNGGFALEPRVGIGVAGLLEPYHFQCVGLTGFLIPRLSEGALQAPPVIVVTNWQTTLKK